MKLKYLTFISINLAFIILSISLLYFSSNHSDVTNVSQISTSSQKNVSDKEKQKSDNLVINGTINDSFFSSALNAGLTSKQIFSFTEALHNSVNFIDGIEDGTPYSIVLDKDTSHIRSFFYTENNRLHTIQLANNGLYYNELGVNLSSNKLILPTGNLFRISSHFSKKRKHPVIGIVQAHVGTDYATPIGTPVMSVSKGIVSRSEYHPLAGNFITIKHNNGITTRYLHLNDRYVNKGDHVYKGEIIGKTGNSGRTTGPHLHFEYIVNNIPQDFTKLHNDIEMPLNNKNQKKLLKCVNLSKTLITKILKEA